jgi:hypothetical protein
MSLRGGCLSRRSNALVNGDCFGLRLAMICKRCTPGIWWRRPRRVISWKIPCTRTHIPCWPPPRTRTPATRIRSRKCRLPSHPAWSSRLLATVSTRAAGCINDRRKPRTLLFIALGLLLFGWVIHAVESTFFLNFLSWGASVSRLYLGVIAVAGLVRRQKSPTQAAT